MEETKKTLKETIQENWRNIPNSVKFWNGLVLLGLIITGIISLEVMVLLLGLMSIFAFVVLVDSIGESEKLDNHLWLWFTPFIWGLLCTGLLIYLMIKGYENTVGKFNTWINSK
jgi:NADH:ubiquinone oxidoreductase subunit 6 (subunit J)